jgi:hypothetical protein
MSGSGSGSMGAAAAWTLAALGASGSWVRRPSAPPTTRVHARWHADRALAPVERSPTERPMQAAVAIRYGSQIRN